MKHELYLHVKTRKLYRLVGPARVEADMSAAVVYTDYPEGNELWIRPHLEFFDGRFRPAGSYDEETFDPISDIKEFHQKFQLDYRGPPRSLPRSMGEFRQKFLQEELDEYKLAQEAAYKETSREILKRDAGEYTYQLEQALDALVDEMYVLLGTSHLHGFDRLFPEAWRRVHRANMSKVRAALDGTDSKRNSPLDVVKPGGWESPSHTDLVECNDLFEAHLDRS